MTLPPLNLEGPLPCKVQIHTTRLADRARSWGLDLGDTYWIRRGVAWAGYLGVGWWAYMDTGVPELDGTEFKGNIIAWDL